MVTVSYIAYLLVFVALFFILFWGYARILGKWLPFFNGVSQGFVGFLAVNEILALPFIIIGLPFKVYLPFFILTNVPVLLYGLIDISRRLKTKPKRPSYILLLVACLAVVLTAFNALLTQAYVKYDADDAYYVSLIEHNQTDENLYQTDPVSGRSSLPLPGIYVLGGWELMLSAAANVIRLPAVEVAHNFVPLLAVPLAAHAAYVLYRLFVRRIAALLAVGFLGIVYLFSGYSVLSTGTFLLTRSWQGKALFAAILVPLLLALYHQLYKKPRDFHLYICIGLLHVAAIALNPSATFIGAVAAACFGLLLLIKHRKILPVIWLGVASLPLVLGGIFAVLSVSQTQPNTEVVGKQSYDLPLYISRNIERFFGGSWHWLIYAAGLIVILSSRKLHNLRPIFLWFPLILFGTFLNPVFYNYVYGYLTGSAYWRMIWLIPMALAVALFASLFVLYVHKRLVRYDIARMLLPVLVVIMSISLIASGSYMFQVDKPLVAKDTTRAKVPPGVEDVGTYLDSLITHEVILAPEDPAAYIHTLTEKHELYLSRLLYVRIYFKEGTQKYDEAILLYKTVNEGINTYDVSIDRFLQLLREHGITLIVYYNVNAFIDQIIAEKNLKPAFVGSRYSVLQVPPIENN